MLLYVWVKNKNWQHIHEILLSPVDLEHWHKCQKQKRNDGNGQRVYNTLDVHGGTELA